MKKIFMAVIAIMMTVSASAQFYIYLSNGDVLQADSVSLIPPATKPVNGVLCGEFSVSDTTKVHFSQGNLQYVGTWQFAENQWDYFGNSQSDNHRDLFGWSFCALKAAVSFATRLRSCARSATAAETAAKRERRFSSSASTGVERT